MEQTKFISFITAVFFCIRHLGQYSIHYVAAEKMYYVIKNQDK